MKRLLTGFFLFVLVASAGAQELGAEAARHLLNRTGFAASAAEINSFSRLARADAADRLLRGARTEAQTPPPAWVEEPITPFRKLRDMAPEARMVEQRRNVQRGFELREWWFREMLDTASPLTEKMTLFWHGHFATSQQKVRFSQLMYKQNVTLRKHALGNFGVLLKEIARDPAMVIYLDSAQNRRGQPNENFAREVMELFTLGEGQYTEQDIKDVARAFTGWSVDQDTADFKFRRFAHDGGSKTIFGRTDRFGGDQVLDMLLQKPQTAEFITRKLWKEFISPTPDDEEVHRFARLFRNSRYDVSVLMRAMLTSDAFYATANRATLVKSPVEFVVGTLKQFDIKTPNLRPFVFASAMLGQNVLSPPNVKGWPGGEQWINSSTLLTRKQLLDRLFRAEDRMDANTARFDEKAEDMQGRAGREARMQRMMQRDMMGRGGGMRMDLEAWTKQFPSQGREAAITRTVLAMAPHHSGNVSQSDPAELVKQLVSDPTYQLK